MEPMNYLQLDECILNALKEDMPLGDITSDNIIKEDAITMAKITAKEQGIICGIEVARRTFELLDPSVKFISYFQDGQEVNVGDVIISVQGKTRELLKAERTALNFMQRLSGIATDTNRYVKLIEDCSAKVVDTRKTTPGLRYLEKYAVVCGGGSNHRYSLSDGVLIKDNHIKAAGGILNAVNLVRGRIPHTVKIEVEVESLDMVNEALEAKADIIMLDNMSVELMEKAVKIIDKKALVEASGDIDDKKIRNVASTGVDIISIGKITRAAGSLDISMSFID